jgi:hypothetical protein
MEKACTKCKTIRPLSEYHNNKNTFDGKSQKCKTCRAQEHLEYYDRPEVKARIQARGIQYHKDNIEKQRAKSKKWHHENKDGKYLNSRLKRAYGIDLEVFEGMLKIQNNACAICRSPETAIHNKTKKVKRLAVDHCHITLQVRGLLCAGCNKALGAFGDNIDTLKRAIEYLTKHKEKSDDINVREISTKSS